MLNSTFVVSVIDGFQSHFAFMYYGKFYYYSISSSLPPSLFPPSHPHYSLSLPCYSLRPSLPPSLPPSLLILSLPLAEAVPCALYAFLHCSSKSFKEMIPYAISLGGDADTIASMAGMYWKKSMHVLIYGKECVVCVCNVYNYVNMQTIYWRCH